MDGHGESASRWEALPVPQAPGSTSTERGRARRDTRQPLPFAFHHQELKSTTSSPLSIKTTILSSHRSIHSCFIYFLHLSTKKKKAMAMKRKRSSDFSPASSTASWSSSRASQSPTPLSRTFHDAHSSSMDIDRPIPSMPIASWNLGVCRLSSTDVNSRTRKRFRDNRPDEEIIHGKLMALLSHL